MPCTTILVGKKASYDGSTIIARNDDGAFEAKNLIVVERNKQASKYKCVISHLELDLPKESLRYTCIPSVNKEKGLWSACGINEENVSMTATETISSNPLVMGADPLVKYVKGKNKKDDVIGGIGEEDLITIVLPYIKSAKEGVYRVGELLEKYGTYEMNGMAFADKDEIWWLETIGGHHFVAARVPDEKVVMMPNSFGLDYFDLEDALGLQEDFICSKDLKQFIEDNHLNTCNDGNFNPRIIFGSHSDQDHLYNTPRAWYMLKYFNPNTYDFNKFTPLSDNLPFSTKPERKVTIEDVKYVLSSYYQNSEYNPYGKDNKAGAYRVIGVPNSDDSGILQIRGYMPKQLQGIEWLSLGGSGFTACAPFYCNVPKMPDYLCKTDLSVSTDSYYWQSRLIAALVDCQYYKNIVFDERYVETVFNKGHELLNKYDKKILETKDYDLCVEANKEIAAMLKKESDETLSKVLKTASEHMKTKYYRGDH